MTTLPPRAGRRCHSFLNPLHSTVYFSPDLTAEMAAIGVTERGSAYFGSRAAAFGPVGAGAVTATFYGFAPSLVARHVPAVWDTAAPETVLAARLRAVDGTLRRLLGDDTVASAGMAEAAELALRAAEACSPAARPLYAAHAALPVPKAPHLAFWHAATLLREHRGDGHLAALLRAGLDPVESLLTHQASGHGMSTKWMLATRGWTEEELTAGQERLRGRGLLAADGELTEEGLGLRKELENETDRMDTAPYEHLGAAGVARLTELAEAFATAAFAAGAFPADLVGKG
ncbi:SCO6745 family protein [Streptomyces albireticuli]|uniref:SalK n=1 Tax=Streptomyces albireticuli TaxID=1940 RepID=A0A2A2DH75_9ACTN|nr:hypothetical protein [Streptomyces albireticuli]MCD9140912.1 hypothetical protein [Streptomyces albireticuli]MCD9161126.1 hypothetical protein [Streptomyces albireticuli]MCD9190816.1 hypothetical protein [Streptomyces albireticuli]PAU50885.1 hypothetical protein CK936_00240 [Streptomyces albireticuli]